LATRRATSVGSSANDAARTPESPLCRNPVAVERVSAYIGAIESGSAVRFRRDEMDNFFGRISENVLFAVLITAVVGWTAVSVAADRGAPPASGSCVVTRHAVPPHASLVAAPAAHTRCAA
jgi:hypothetical protein